MRILILCILIMYSSMNGLAGESQYNDAKEQGKKLGVQKSMVFTDVINNGLDQEFEGGVTLSEGLNFKGTNVPEASISPEMMETVAKERFSSENNDIAKTVKRAMGHNSFRNFVKNGTLLDKAKNVQKNPYKIIDWLTSKVNNCEPGNIDQEHISKVKEVCDIYTEIRDNKCLIGKAIEVDAEHLYECNESKDIYFKNCRKDLEVVCDRKFDCDSGGIILGTVESDIKWEYSYPMLNIGTISDNYWSGQCAIFERSTKFFINNFSYLHEVIIEEVGYDDFMEIKVNGHQVFNGPFGGNFLTVKRGKVITSHGKKHNCEQGISRVDKTAIDIKPYLKEGSNEIAIKVVISGHGEGWMKIRTRQYCCEERDVWSEKCD